MRMTATEAAHRFSELLSRVAAGEEIEVIRSGAEVAVISLPQSQLMSAGQFRALIATAPVPDETFLEDVRAARRSVGPPEDAWGRLTSVLHDRSATGHEWGSAAHGRCQRRAARAVAGRAP